MTPTQIRKARKKLKLTQRAIAEKLEISERYWVYREMGVMPITRWLARAVRDLLRFPKKDA